LGALALPATPSKEIEDEESQVGVIAVPDSDAVCVLLIGAFVLMVSVPAGRVPKEVEGGVRVTEIVQWELASSVPPAIGHVPDTA
jgi:hypothetical protein